MKKTSLSARFSRWTLLHLTLLVIVASAPLSAATVTWIGSTGVGSNTLWDNGTNWGGGSAPQNGDIVVFPASPTIPGSYTVTYNVASTLSLAQINIYTPSLVDGGVWNINVVGTPVAPLVPLALNIHGPTVANVRAPINIVTGTTLAVAVDLGSTLNMLGVISGTGAGNLLFAGPADTTMAGTLSNTYVGTTTVQAGTLFLSRTGGATSIAGPLLINSVNATVSVVTLAGAANAIAGTVEVTVAANATFDLTNANGTNQTPDNETIGALLGAGNVILGTHTLGVSYSANPTTFTGLISGTGGFRKTGTGTQRLTGPNSYTGTTTISNAALTILGLQPASPVSLRSGTLKLANGCSVGTITTTAAFSTSALVIGSEPSATNMASSKDLDLSGAGANTSRLDVFSGSAATSSTLSVVGTVTLGNAPLVVNTAAFTPLVGTVWIIIDNDGTDAVIGTFSGLAQGATFASANNPGTTFTISYTGGTNANDVTLTVATVASDTTPPVITAIAAGSITDTSATITWTTNENSDSLVEYGLTAAYGTTTSLSTGQVMSHSKAVTGLTASTLYHYRVKSTDAAGNLGTSADNTFTTIAASGTGSATAGTTGTVATTSSSGSSCGLGGGGLALILTLGLFAARRRT